MSFPAACLLRAGVVCALGACSMFVHAAQRTFVASTGSDAGRTFGNNALTGKRCRRRVGLARHRNSEVTADGFELSAVAYSANGLPPTFSVVPYVR